MPECSEQAVAVFDVGKTNVKLVLVSADGRLLETLARPNPVLPGPPYRHHDLDLLETWLLESLQSARHRHAIGAIVCCGHGSGGVLVGEGGTLMPMIDYEQPAPPGLDDAYSSAVGGFRERGSAIMFGMSHLARQLLWLERDWPEAVARARAYLALPQFWAWRLSGVLASEVTSLAAQSHLWCTQDARFAQIVQARGWARLMPPMRPAWAILGPLKPAYAVRTGLPSTTRVLNGIHDSSANFYRYQAAGLRDMTVVSTGTWIVPISDRQRPDFDQERPGLCCNADAYGDKLPGLLVMGGREFGAVAADAKGPASLEMLARIIATDTMALPFFGPDDCLFPGTARTGAIEGGLAGDRSVRFTLAVLYAALLTDCCLDMVDTATVVLDGNFVRDPLYGRLIASLRPGRRILVNPDTFGTIAGAALLASHETRSGPVRLPLERPGAIDMPGLAAYAASWRERSHRRRQG